MEEKIQEISDLSNRIMDENERKNFILNKIDSICEEEYKESLRVIREDQDLDPSTGIGGRGEWEAEVYRDNLREELMEKFFPSENVQINL